MMSLKGLKLQLAVGDDSGSCSVSSTMLITPRLLVGVAKLERLGQGLNLFNFIRFVRTWFDSKV